MSNDSTLVVSLDNEESLFLAHNEEYLSNSEDSDDRIDQSRIYITHDSKNKKQYLSMTTEQAKEVLRFLLRQLMPLNTLKVPLATEGGKVLKYEHYHNGEWVRVPYRVWLDLPASECRTVDVIEYPTVKLSDVEEFLNVRDAHKELDK